MYRVWGILVLFLTLLGCETADFYTNPQSAGYQQQAFGAICEKCGRAFAVSAYQINNVENVTCPYDGHAQNTKFAYNRYVYAAQQQQQTANQDFLRIMQERQKQTNEQINNIYNKYWEEQNKRSTTYTKVQTGNIVYKIDQVHSLHFTVRRTSYAVESDKPNGSKIPACNRPPQRTF